MKISTKGRYALRMMLDISEHQADGYVALKDIASRQEISKKYLEQIALHLSQCGMLRAVRGYQGGYMLSRAPEDYTVAEILGAVEGTLAPVNCLDAPVNECSRCQTCKTLRLWMELERVVMDYLNSVTLRDVAEGRVGQRA